MVLCVLQSFTVTEPLTALTSLALQTACEIKDAAFLLPQMPKLRVTFDTLSKVYHGEWWPQLRALHSKLPRRCGLAVAGLYPTALEVLHLHSESPEPVLITTDKVSGQSRPYPHEVRIHHLLAV